MNSFKNLPLLPQIQKSLDILGFSKPTEIQSKTIPLLIEDFKQDVHAQAQTGTGKTLAFGIPLLQAIDRSVKNVQGLVVAPTRELVLQIYEQLKEVSPQTGISIEPIYGGMPIDRQIDRIKRGAQIIIGTPGRLNDHLRRKTLSLRKLKILVLDEADIMLDMGFKQEIDTILDAAPADRHIWLFSATIMSGIQRLIKSHMKNVQTFKAEQKEVSPQVKQYYCIVPMRRRVEAIARFIEATPNFYGIVFCRTKLLTAEIMEQLASKGFRVNCLHGDMKQALRNKVIKGFKNKDFSILIATDVAARGIDVSDLTHVINYTIPEETESYIHRIGRTGRAGREGIAIMFASPADTYRIKRLERSARTSLQEIPIPSLDMIINEKMGAVSDFIEQAKQPDDKSSQTRKVLTELINSFSDDEIRRSFAVALEDKFFKDIIREDLTNMSHDFGSISQEICLDIGTDAGISEDEVRSYLYKTCTLLPKEVRKVRVLNKKTFIAVPNNRMQDVLKTMRANPIGNKRYKIYLVEDIRQDRRPQRPRGQFGEGKRGPSRSRVRPRRRR